MKYVVIMSFLIVLIAITTSNVFAFEPSSTNYFSNSEFKIYKLQEKAYEFSIPYNISNAELDKINVDCNSTALIVYLDKVAMDGKLVINIPRALLDMKINEQDVEFIVILDQLEVEYLEVNTETDSRTLDIPLRQGEKTLEIIATSVGMFPEPNPCGVGGVDKSPYYRFVSPLKQFNSGITYEEIKCKDNLVLIQKYDDSPACVTSETKTKLVERGWGNKTILVQNSDFAISYSVTKGELIGAMANLDTQSLVLDVQMTDDGNMTLKLPRGLIDSIKNGKDEPFTVLVNGEKIDYAEQITLNYRTINVLLPLKTESVEIVPFCYSWDCHR